VFSTDIIPIGKEGISVIKTSNIAKLFALMWKQHFDKLQMSSGNESVALKCHNLYFKPNECKNLNERRRGETTPKNTFCLM
jgi:hypothetical protein